MDEIHYLNEWILPGKLGHLLAITSMVAALFATITYSFAVKNQTQLATDYNSNHPIPSTAKYTYWKRWARYGFSVHAFSVFGVVAILFFLILNHRFEYKYVWQHSSVDLPWYYMTSAFWEGQEGSFLLWGFWLAVLGFVVMRTAKRWEAPVMAVVSLSQFFLAAMLIGIYFFNYKIGSSPFLLFREADPQTPLFMRADYLNFIEDGSGLNPLLQNYWMVIHPPTLFLGFAASLMPFAYIIGALWKGIYSKDWVKHTLVWSSFAAGVLGLGVLMGGAWAYEALSFGGFWAWDPVENASFVPWLVLVGAIHTLLVYKHTGRALHTTAILGIISYVLILYSTFLTRSGVLGETSVHSFTDLGMSGQLLSFLLFFVIGSTVLLILRWRSMPSPKGEESVYSREFWMFIGSIILLLFATLVIKDTSLPVINKILGTNYVITDIEPHYNKYAIWFAIIIGLATATVQYLRYKSSTLPSSFKKIIIPTIAAIVLSIIIYFTSSLQFWAYGLLLFVAVYAILANAHYIITVLKGKIKVSGGAVTHIALGFLLLGIVLSSAQKEVISLNTLGIKYGEEFDAQNQRENILLYKDQPMKMGEYWVTYQGDSLNEPNTYYKVKYERKDRISDPIKESFYLYPNAQINPEMGLLANPDTKHYLTRDIFTHVSSVPDKSDDAKEISKTTRTLGIGDTIITNNAFIVLKDINPQPDSTKYFALDGDIAAGATLEVISMQGEKFPAEPIYFIRENQEWSIPAELGPLGISIDFDRIMPETGQIELSITEEESVPDFIIMKAVVFPFINVLWLGCILLFIGFLMSAWQRLTEKVAWPKASRPAKYKQADTIKKQSTAATKSSKQL